MVYFHIPFVSIDEGVASSDLEDSLSQFNENFKSFDSLIPSSGCCGYELFDTSDIPYLLFVLGKSSKELPQDLRTVGVIVASYSQEKNQEVLDEFKFKTEIDLGIPTGFEEIVRIISLEKYMSARLDSLIEDYKAKAKGEEE